MPTARPRLLQRISIKNKEFQLVEWAGPLGMSGNTTNKRTRLFVVIVETRALVWHGNRYPPSA